MIEFVDNFFTKDQLFYIDHYIDDTKEKYEWRSSYGWNDNIKWGVDSRTLIREAPDFVRQKIIKHFNFKDDDNLFVLIHLWFPGSHIGWHDDERYDIAGTIYLNEDWHPNFGGLFLYSEGFDKSSLNPLGEIKAVVPKYNTLNINRENNGHAISSTLLTAPIRKTIQFFHVKQND